MLRVGRYPRDAFQARHRPLLLRPPWGGLAGSGSPEFKYRGGAMSIQVGRYLTLVAAIVTAAFAAAIIADRIGFANGYHAGAASVQPEVAALQKKLDAVDAKIAI